MTDIVQWLIDNPQFEDRPATMRQFLGPGYLDMDFEQNPSLGESGVIRPGVKDALIEIFGEQIDPECISEKREAVFTGGIGIGKTTMASIALAYMVHWVCCLRDPQKFFGMMPDRRIAFMLMSTKDSQAKEVLFGDIKANVDNSEWFKNMDIPWRKPGFNARNKAYDPDYKNQLRFPKNIWVIPGNSAETSFEGYNILGGVLDEGDSHKVTEEKDYAKEGYRTIRNRITSRFTNPKTGTHRGLLITIGQTKKADGFMSNMSKALEKRSDATVVRMALWESIGWDKYEKDRHGRPKVFYFDVDRKIIVPPGPAKSLGKDGNIIKIPEAFLSDFTLDPVQALKDHAGIPPAVDDPFIPAPNLIDEAQEKWKARMLASNKPIKPVFGRPNAPKIHDDLRGDSLRRAIHVDIAYASNGDALGMAMGHIPEMVDMDGELKPYIVFDFILRIKPSGGQQLMLRDFRKIIIDLRNQHGFKIDVVTFDGFQSQDSIQLLRHDHKFNTDELSVDRKKGPYEDLREAILERRIEFPEYITEIRRGDNEKVNIAKKELLELTDTGRKIDHPPKGSKDVADAMAGVTYALLAGRNFRRGASRRPQAGFTSSPVVDPDSTYFGADVANQRVLTPDQLGQVPSTPRHPVERASAVHGLPPIEHDPFAALRRAIPR
jgi:hypothetical protein